MIATLFAALVAGRELWLVDPTGMDAPRLALVQSVQGLANRSGPLVWQKVGGMTTVLIDQLRAEGWSVRETKDPWEVAEAFRRRIRGGVLCDASDESLNAAATWAGLEDLLVIDESLRAQAEARGWRIRRDARRETPPPSRLRRDLAVEQPPEKAGFLRDYAIRHRAECYWAGDRQDERQRKVARLEPGAAVIELASGSGGGEPRPIAADAGFSYFRARQLVVAMGGSVHCERRERFARVAVVLPLGETGGGGGGNAR